VDAARKRGLRVGFEFSTRWWTAAAWRASLPIWRIATSMARFPCAATGYVPSAPTSRNVREYAVNAFSEVVEKYQVDWVESAIVLMDEAGRAAARWVAADAFAPACKKAAPGFGVRSGEDPGGIAERIRRRSRSSPQWQQFRYDSVVAFYKHCTRGAQAKPGAVLRYNMHAKNLATLGVDSRAAETAS